jgi:hypothetical protein
MCHAIPLAALLMGLLAGLTLLRCVAGSSPNADLLIKTLDVMEGAGMPAPRPGNASRSAGPHRRSLPDALPGLPWPSPL